MMLSAHFSLEELCFSAHARRLGLDNIPGREAIDNLRGLVGSLERIRTHLGRPIQILSGYRSELLNAATPGASATSAHTLGLAADLHVDGIGPFELCRQISGLAVPFDQIIYEYSSWCHFGLGHGLRGMLLTKKEGSGYAPGLIE